MALSSNMKFKISIFITGCDISTSGKNLDLEFRSLETFFVIKLKFYNKKRIISTEFRPEQSLLKVFIVAFSD